MSERFLSRWARLKRGDDPAQPPAGQDPAAARPAADGVAPVVPATGARAADPVPADDPQRRQADALRAPPAPGDAPTRPGAAGASRPPVVEPLPDLASLTPQSDFRPFMRQGVDAAQRNAAMKTLFTDPHFNVMDGLDIYIDDYNKTTPIPPEMLRQMVQSEMLGLFRKTDEEEKAERARGASDGSHEPPGEPAEASGASEASGAAQSADSADAADAADSGAMGALPDAGESSPGAASPERMVDMDVANPNGHAPASRT
jgi:hypothetical protein